MWEKNDTNNIPYVTFDTLYHFNIVYLRTKAKFKALPHYKFTAKIPLESTPIYIEPNSTFKTLRHLNKNASSFE